MEAIDVLVPADVLTKKPSGSRLVGNEIFALAVREGQDAVVNHLNAGLQPRHPVDRSALLADDEVRIGERAAVKQVRRDRRVVALKGFPVDVLVGE